MELLSEEQLGSPSHIIIHTGSNKLRTQQDRVSESLRGVTQQQSGDVHAAAQERLPPRHHPQDQQQHLQGLHLET